MKVIYLKSELKSFSWNDGLFAIEKEVDGVLHLWKIGEDGRLKKYSNGQSDICCTGVNNKGIHETDLMTIAAPSLYEENIKLRQELDSMHSNMQYYMEYCQANGYVTPMEWIEKHKHF